MAAVTVKQLQQGSAKAKPCLSILMRPLRKGQGNYFNECDKGKSAILTFQHLLLKYSPFTTVFM